MTTIGVAVPCYHGHVTILKNLLDSIQRQTRKPDKVVVSCSGVTKNSIPYKQEDYTYPLEFITSELKLNTAQNRNIAAGRLNTDIISFMDADDYMYPQRIEVIEEIFKQTKAVMLLHSFSSFQIVNDFFYDMTKIPFDMGKIILTPIASHSENSSFDIQNGHCSIRKEVFNLVKYRETEIFYGREDSFFVAEVVFLFSQQVGYCPLRLSNYVPTATYSFVP